MISIVIPHFDDDELLAARLPKYLDLLKEVRLPHEILVVDDRSSDESREKLRDLSLKYPGVKFIFKDRNEGFASTVDLGIKEASGEIVYVLKADSYPRHANYFKLVLGHFAKPSVFSVSTALETVEDGKKEIRGKGLIYFEKGFFLHKRGSNEAGITAWADGGAAAIRREYYLRIGGLDKLYDPFYWEDVDLGYRAWRAGYTIEFEPKAALVHEHTKGTIARHYGERERRIVAQRNQFIFVWKNSDLRHLLLYQLWEPYNHLVAIKNRDMVWIRAYWRAVIRWPEILGRRVFQRKINRRTDDEVLQLFSTN